MEAQGLGVKVSYSRPSLFPCNATLVASNSLRRSAQYVVQLSLSICLASVFFGPQIYSQTRLVDLVPLNSKNPASLTLTPVASTPATVTPRVTVLNLPRQHMLSLPSLASTMPTRNQAILKCVAFEVPKRLGPIDTDSLKPTSALSKAYVYYTDAWWRTKLSLIEGQFPDNGFWPMVSNPFTAKTYRQLIPLLP
jgi:hypothetical protein